MKQQVEFVSVGKHKINSLFFTLHTSVDKKKTCDNIQQKIIFIAHVIHKIYKYQTD